MESKDLTGNRFWDQPGELEGCGGVFYPSADASVALYDPSTNFGSGEVLFVEHSPPPGSPVSRSFLKFDLDGRIPAEAVIHSAELELTLSHPPLPSQSLLLGTASLPQEWDEYTVTWDNQPPTGYESGTKSYSPIWSETEPVYLRVDVSTLVNLWATQVFHPTSLALIPGDEQLDFNFFSRESATPPRLVVRCSPVVEPPPRSYQELNDRQMTGIERLNEDSSSEATIQLGESGAVRFGSFDITPPSVYTDSLGRALWFTQSYSDVLRISDPETELQLVRLSEDEADLFFRQRYAGIPVLGSEINIHFLGDHITGLSGSYLSDLRLDPTPQIPAERARQIALALGEPGAAVISEDQLRLLNRSLFHGDNPRTYLTWMVALSQNGGRSCTSTRAQAGCASSSLAARWALTSTSRPSTTTPGPGTTATTTGGRPTTTTGATRTAATATRPRKGSTLTTTSRTSTTTGRTTWGAIPTTTTGTISNST